MATRGRAMPMPGMIANPGGGPPGRALPGVPPRTPAAAPAGAPGGHDASRGPAHGGVAALPGFTPFAPKAGGAPVQASTELFNAALANDFAGVKKGADDGGDVNVPDLKGVTPLLLAVHNQNVEMVKFLLSKKADPNATSTNSSPVHEAVRVHNQPILDIVVGAGGNVSLTTDFGKTALHMAIQEEQEAIFDYLLNKKSDVKAKNDGKVSCLHFASAGKNLKILEKVLAMKDTNINERNGNGKTALHIAAEKNNIDTIKILLNKGADPTIKDGWGRLAEECGAQSAYHLIHDHKPGTKHEIVDPDAPEKKGDNKPLFDVGDVS